MYRDIVGCSQAGDGPAQQRDEDTGVDDSCCQRQPVSAGDAMNALAVLRDWLECSNRVDYSHYTKVNWSDDHDQL